MTEFKFKTSKKADGPMNFVGHPEFDQERLANRSAFLDREFSIKNSQTVIPKLVHGSTIEIVENSNLLPGLQFALLECDGLITTKKGLALTVGAGDCYPVFIYDPVGEVICLLHCGWRGLADRIVEKALLTLLEQFGSQRANLHVQVGPGICEECYEVGTEVLNAFHIYAEHTETKAHFSLLKEIERQTLIVPDQNKHFSAFGEHPCTFHNSEYFSFRRDGKIGGVTNYQMTVAIMQ